MGDEVQRDRGPALRVPGVGVLGLVLLLLYGGISEREIARAEAEAARAAVSPPDGSDAAATLAT